MSEPRRLLSDPSAPSGLRNDLSAAAGGAWGHYDEAAGLARLEAAIALLPGPGDGGPNGGPDGSPDGGPGEGGSPHNGVGPAQGPSAAPGAGAGAGGAGTGAGASGAGLFGGKLLGAIAIGALSAVGVSALWLALEGGEPPPSPGAIAMTAAAPAKGQASASADVSGAMSAAPAPAAESATAASAEPLPAAAGAPSHSASAQHAAAKNALGDEVAQLGRIRAALANDPARALAMVDEGNQSFKGGTLGPERELIAIDALSRLGRKAEAAERGRRLLSRVPDGPFAERVHALIGP